MRGRAKGGREQGDRCSAPAGIWVPAHFLTQKTHPSSSRGRRDHPSVPWGLERKHPDVGQREARNADLTFQPDPFCLGPRGPVRSRPVSGTDLHSAPCRRPGGLRVPGAPGRVTRRSHTRLCLKDQGGFKTGRKEMSRVIVSHRLTGWGKGEREESSHPVWGNRTGRAYSSQTVT